MLSALADGTPEATEAGAVRYAAALAAALENPGIDDAYKAELLKLPTPSDIARERAPTSILPPFIKAHRALSRQLATSLAPVLEKIYATAASTCRIRRMPKVPGGALCATRR